MKQNHLLKSLLLLCALIVGSMNVWATLTPGDFSTVETSNCTLTAGTNGSTCTVNGKDGIKVGTSSKGGDITITVPAGTKFLHLHAAAWNGVNGLSLNITPNTYSSTTSIALTADDGISGNSPFTLSGSVASTNFYKVITFTEPIAANTNLKFTSSTAKRFVIWGVNAEGLPTSVSLNKDATTLTAGGDSETLTATVLPASTSTLSINNAVTWESDNPSVATVDENGEVTPITAGTANITATSKADDSKSATCVVTVNAATSPVAMVSETDLAFGEVEVGKTKSLTFTVTPANLTGDLTIACNNAKYTVTPASITQATTTETTITVTAAPTALDDDMDGTITISGGGITPKTVTLSAALYQVSNVTLVAAGDKGTFKQGDDVVTSVVSRIGNTVTIKAIPVTGYIFSSWEATGATPASSTDAETEFTLNDAAVTLTANFVADPKFYYTLDDGIPTPTANGSYGDKRTFSQDGLTWEVTTYPAKDIKALQMRVRTNASGGGYIKLPIFSGKIQSITFSVTNASANTKGGSSTTSALYFQENGASDGSIIATSNSDDSNTKVIDLSGEDYSTGYITASGGVRIWDITVAYIPTDYNVTISSAKYATFCDHLARDFSGTGITVYKAKVEGSVAKLTEVSDGIVPANTGVILYHATADTYAVPVTTTDASLSDNELVGTTGETAVSYSDGEKYNYILQMDGANPVFRKATGNKIRANRAYLSTRYDVTIAGAPALDIIIEGENSDDVTTGIDTIEHSTLNIEHSEVYNLNGQRVAQPTKGLYIVNGRKVVIK